MGFLNTCASPRITYACTLRSMIPKRAWGPGASSSCMLSTVRAYLHFIWCVYLLHDHGLFMMVLFGQGRQRCCLESSSNPTWAKGRILKIIDALGKKAKLSIFRKCDLLAIALLPTYITITSGDCNLGIRFVLNRLVLKLTHDIASL